MENIPESQVTASKALTSSKPLRSLLHTTSIVAIMTSLSRILGFLRDLITAHFFGADAVVDAFLIAFKIPNFLRRLFAEGAFTQAFVPAFAYYREKNSEKSIQQFINQVGTTLASALFIASLLGILFAPLIIFIFAPGFALESYRHDLSTALLRVTFPYLFFVSLAAFCSAILNSYERFGVSSFTPVLLNVAMIFCTVFLRDLFNLPIFSLAIGVVLGGILQLFFQYPFLKKLKISPKFLFGELLACYKCENVQQVLKLMIPALFGVSIAQFNLLIDTLFASFLPAGSISWLYFSDRLIEFPLGVFGIALATVSLPRLSRYVAAKDYHSYDKTLNWGMRISLLIGIPCAIGLAVLSLPILYTLFQYGEFSSRDVVMTAQSLIAFALGIPAFMSVKILASAFFSYRDVKTPVRIGVIAMLTNLLLNTLLLTYFAHMGLALATTIAAYVNAICLFVILKRKRLFNLSPGWKKFLLQITAANTLLSIVLFLGMPESSAWITWSWLDRSLNLGWLIALGAIAYFSVLIGLKFDWHSLKQS